MKEVLISIQPKWCEKIVNGKKTIEVRKTCPKIETPFKCYIYCTKGKDGNMFNNQCDCVSGHIGNGKVIGEFVCDKIKEIDYIRYWNNEYEFITCLSYNEIAEYGKGNKLYSWLISNLKIYDTPKELGNFLPYCEGRGCCDGGAVWDGNEWHYGVTCGYSAKNCLRLTRPPQSWCYVEVMAKES